MLKDMSLESFKKVADLIDALPEEHNWDDHNSYGVDKQIKNVAKDFFRNMLEVEISPTTNGGIVFDFNTFVYVISAQSDGTVKEDLIVV